MPAAPASSRVDWMTARARNALRRGPLLGSVGVLVFLTTLIVLAVALRSAASAARDRQARAGQVVDSIPRLAEVTQETRDLAAIETGLGNARDLARERTARRAALDSAGSAPGVVPLELVPRRDSLLLISTTLGQLLARVEAAPLPTSYRAIGESWAMRGEPRVAPLLDSLAALEVQRQQFDDAGSIDPAYIALTTRVADVGRTLQQLAQERRAVARRDLATLAVAAAPPPPVADDTTARLLAAAAARERVAFAQSALARVRQHNAGVVVRLAAARRVGVAVVPPGAIIAASLMMGLVVAFSSAMVAELRGPRLADAREAERVTGVRVLAEVEPPDAAPERTRRSADRETSPLLDPTLEAYRLLYLQVATTGSTIPLVTVTGDDPEVSATVATNLAAVAALEAHSTLLIDGALAHGLVARVLRIPREPGLSAIISGREEWSRTIVSTPIGRSRYLDVIPSGRIVRATPTREEAEQVRRDLARYAGRYDLAILVAPPDLAEQGDKALLPAPDVILCARAGHTTLRELAASADALRGAGTRLRGVVIWHGDVPRIVGRGPDLPAPGRDDMSWTATRAVVAGRG